MLSRNMKLLVIDVDGTLTDGSIIYDNNGNELKKFCVKDGTGLSIAKASGIQIMILTGRYCQASERRFHELKVDFLFQDVSNKADFLLSFLKEKGYSREDVGYIGDDLNDIRAMSLCDFVGCPEDSCEEVKTIANYTSSKKGGHGAVRDIIEYYLKEKGIWTKLIMNFVEGYNKQ